MSLPSDSNVSVGRKIVGLLALQGDYRAHGRVCESLNASLLEVRFPDQLDRCTHLIVPGGESTTYLKLLDFRSLTEPLHSFIESGKPVLATCAGLILICREVVGNSQRTLELLDAAIERNAYGRQVDSFETGLEIPDLSPDPFHGVFIRAPIIRSAGDKVEVLSSYDGNPVLVRQGNILAATFHPELADDSRLHELFLSL